MRTNLRTSCKEVQRLKQMQEYYSVMLSITREMKNRALRGSAATDRPLCARNVSAWRREAGKRDDAIGRLPSRQAKEAAYGPADEVFGAGERLRCLRTQSKRARSETPDRVSNDRSREIEGSRVSE